MPVEFVEAAWPGPVETLVAQAIERSGLYEPEDILDLLRRGLMRLWVAGSKERGAEAVAISEILQYPRALVFSIILCTGQDRERWKSHRLTMERWAREQGCQISRPVTRKGWAKELDDHRLTHYVWEKRL